MQIEQRTKSSKKLFLLCILLAILVFLVVKLDLLLMCL
nr:MAG TPA: Glycine rich protein family [Caudoviricetes sp.]DAV93404.1 MAG TPA: Glycine rich protein family [Caudoviricetes sp.]